jgi:hypothetical protein
MKELINKYPLAFRSLNGVVWETIECADGWEKLLEPPLAYMHKFNQNVDEAQMMKVDQIKEKFGTLRFYTNFTDEELQKLIGDAEKMSAKTCEACGQPGQMRGKNWLYTACEEHTKAEHK